MSRSHLALSIAFLSLMSACQDHASDDPSSDGRPPDTNTAGSEVAAVPDGNPLHGSWLARCRHDEVHAEYEQISLHITDRRHTIQVSYYADASCTALLRQVQLTGQYATELAAVLPDDDQASATMATTTATTMAMATTGNRIWPIRLTLETLALSLFASAELAAANAAVICGNAVWQQGVSFDVSDCPEAQPPIPWPLEIFDSAMLDDGRLYTGTAVAGSAANRPRQMDVNDYLVRQRANRNIRSIVR